MCLRLSEFIHIYGGLLFNDKPQIDVQSQVNYWLFPFHTYGFLYSVSFKQSSCNALLFSVPEFLSLHLARANFFFFFFTTP
jgi:hypothetical protein